MRFLYIALSYALTPLVVFFLLWRGIRAREYWRRLPERFGVVRPAANDGCIWVHAVSVGEVQASAVLIRRIQTRHPELSIHVTTVTPTGSARVRDLFGDSVSHSYAPYDLPGSVRRFFRRVRPKVAIIVETELWPTLYHECGKQRIPLILASARISPRSVGTYRRFISLFREALSHGIVIAAQSEADSQRFRTLGANPARTHVAGNIKFDFEMPAAAIEEGRRLRQIHASDRPVFVAASTHENEESLVLDAFEQIRKRWPRCLLVLVPRHPERFRQVASLLQERGLSFVTRTSGEACDEQTRVLLVDTLGELQSFYGTADVAFVGGSLVPVGGHNLLEPATVGLPIITGSYLFNTEDIAERLVECDGAVIVDSPAELAREVVALLEDPERADRVGGNARDMLEANRGAVDRLLGLVEPLLIA